MSGAGSVTTGQPLACKVLVRWACSQSPSSYKLILSRTACLHTRLNILNHRLMHGWRAGLEALSGRPALIFPLCAHTRCRVGFGDLCGIHGCVPAICSPEFMSGPMWESLQGSHSFFLSFFLSSFLPASPGQLCRRSWDEQLSLCNCDKQESIGCLVSRQLAD